MNNASWQSVANVLNGVSLQLEKRNVKEIGEPTHLSCDKREPPDLLNCVLKSHAWTILNVKFTQLCLTLQPQGHPWNFLCQNTGVGSLSLLQGIFQTQGSNPGLSHCMDSLPAEPSGKPKNTGVGSLFLLQQNFWAQESNLPLLQGIFPAQGSNPDLPHCRQILYQLIHKGSLELPQKVKNTTTMWFCNPTPGHVSGEKHN